MTVRLMCNNHIKRAVTIFLYRLALDDDAGDDGFAVLVNQRSQSSAAAISHKKVVNTGFGIHDNRHFLTEALGLFVPPNKSLWIFTHNN